jgi:SPP1 gp7 family putative phage head morphogenesis protein
VDARGGPGPVTLAAPTYGNPDPELVKETERLILFSYLVGMDHATTALDLADAATEFEAVQFSEALAFMKARVPLTKLEWTQLEEQVRFRAFTVAALSEPDAIERVRRQAIAALEQGRPMAEFWEAAKLEDAAGIGQSPWYWETVYRTNTQTAYNAGRAAEFTRNQPEYLEFVGIEDSRQTSICSERSGIILPASHPFWSSNWPPLHFNCRSTVRALYREEVEALREEDPDWQPSSGAKLPGGTSATGFGGNPIQSGSFWKMTPGMKERAEKYGIMPEIKKLVTGLGLDPSTLNIVPSSQTSISAITTKPSGAPKFRSVKDAENFVIREGLADTCSFKGCELSVVQEWVDGLSDRYSSFPELRQNMQFFGTIQERNKRLQKIIERQMIEALAVKGYTGQAAVDYATKMSKQYIRQYKAKETVLAEFAPFDGVRGIALNQRYGADASLFKKIRESDVASGWKPLGTDKIVATFHHESGHLLDFTYGLSSDSELNSIYSRLSVADIANGLSGYAARSRQTGYHVIDEFIAEAWSEYSLSKTPRPIAKAVGELIERRKRS